MDNKERNNRDNRDSRNSRDSRDSREYRDNRENRNKSEGGKEDPNRNANLSHKRPFIKREDRPETDRPRKFGATDFNDRKVFRKQDEGVKPWETDSEDLKDFEKEIGQEKGRAAKFKEENKKKFSKDESEESFEDDVPFNVKPVKKSSKVNIRPDKYFDDDDLDDTIGGYQKIKKTKK